MNNFFYEDEPITESLATDSLERIQREKERKEYAEKRKQIEANRAAGEQMSKDNTKKAYDEYRAQGYAPYQRADAPLENRVAATIQNTAVDAKKSGEAAVEKAKEEASEKVEEVKDSAKTVLQNARDAVGVAVSFYADKAKEKANEIAAKAKDKASEVITSAKETAKEAADKAAPVVKKAAVGTVVGGAVATAVAAAIIADSNKKLEWYSNKCVNIEDSAKKKKCQEYVKKKTVSMLRSQLRRCSKSNNPSKCTAIIQDKIKRTV